MTDDTVEFSATQQDAGDGAPGATAAFPYDRMTVERFREAFPRARWRDDLHAWFVPGTRAERRLRAWSGREWSGVLAHADQRGRDAFTFEPITSPYLEVADDLVVRTPYSRTVIAELRAVPWARWDPASKAWRVPFRSFEELRRHWPAIEAATRRAEPEERRKLCTGAAIRRLSTRHGGPGGAIVNLASVAARTGGLPGLIPYAATKGAIETFTRGVANEVALEGIRVNAVSPGLIQTDMVSPALAESAKGGIPIGRLGQPEDIAEAVAFLLSPAAAYMTGSVVTVSGGR